MANTHKLPEDSTGWGRVDVVRNVQIEWKAYGMPTRTCLYAVLPALLCSDQALLVEALVGARQIISPKASIRPTVRVLGGEVVRAIR